MTSLSTLCKCWMIAFLFPWRSSLSSPVPELSGFRSLKNTKCLFNLVPACIVDWSFLLPHEKDRWNFQKMLDSGFSETSQNLSSFTQFLFSLLLKGQLIWKQTNQAEDSPKKRTKTRRTVVKTNSFVRFLGESLAWQFVFEINWPLARVSIVSVEKWVGLEWSPVLNWRIVHYEWMTQFQRIHNHERLHMAKKYLRWNSRNAW